MVTADTTMPHTDLLISPVTYALSSTAAPDALRYIGESEIPLSHRRSNHVSHAKAGHATYEDSGLGDWIRGELDAGRDILITEYLDEGDAFACEADAIAHARATGHDLLNEHPGRTSGRRRRRRVTLSQPALDLIGAVPDRLAAKLITEHEGVSVSDSTVRRRRHVMGVEKTFEAHATSTYAHEIDAAVRRYTEAVATMKEAA